MASGSLDRTIQLWRVQRLVGAGSLAATLPGDTAGVTALAFTPDSAELVSGSTDRTLRTWAATPDEELRVLGRAPGAAVSAQWAGKTIAAVWSSGVGVTWDGQTRRRLATFHAGPAAGYTSLALSRDGSVVAAGRSDGETDVERADGTGLQAGTLPAAVVAVAVSPHGDEVAAADKHGHVELWAPSGADARWRVRLPAGIAALTFSPRGDVLAVAGRGGTTLLDAKDGSRRHVLLSPAGDTRVVFSPDGRLVAAAGADHTARVWFATSGRLFRALRGHTQPLTDLAFSRDGRLLATSARDADVRVWNLARDRGRVLERRAFGSVAAVGFDRTGNWVVAAAPISAVVWQTTTGRALFYLRGNAPLLTSASFAPDRPTVLTSSQDGTVRVYDCVVCVDLRALVQLAERRLAAS